MTLSGNEQKLLLAVVSSVELSNVKWDSVAKELGCTESAARQRWTYFKKKLGDSKGRAAPSTPEAKKFEGKGGIGFGNGKGIGFATPVSIKKKSGVKKRKRNEYLDTSDEEEEMIDMKDFERIGKQELEGADKKRKLDLGVTDEVEYKNEEAATETPTPYRRMPARKARATSFVEEHSNDDSAEEIYEPEVGEGSVQEEDGFEEVKEEWDTEYEV